MSEAELHVLRARLIGGVLNKARRGELKLPLPVGLTYDPLDRVVLDPDQQVQHAVRLLFTTFRRTGSASATVREFQAHELLFPRHVKTGPRKGELVWGALLFSRVLQILHNPRYAGAFVYGRHQTRPTPAGHEYRTVPREEWAVLIRDAHPGYITWAAFEHNLERLLANAWAFGEERRRVGPPREGPALLQGLVVCGRCGERMTLRYHAWRKRLIPEYVCQHQRIQREAPICQLIHGSALDAAIGELLSARSTHWPWKPRWPSRRRWRHARWKPTVSDASTSSVHGTTQSSRSTATCAFIRITGWSPTLSRPSGMPVSASSPMRSRRTSASAPPPSRRWMLSSEQPS